MSENSSSSRHRDDVVESADLAIQVLAAQISANYLKFIRLRVVPQLEAFSNIPSRELRTLMTIAHSEAPIVGSRISQILSFDPATVSRSTSWLIEKNLIIAVENTEDARSIVFQLTPKGVELSVFYSELSKQAIAELDADDPSPFNSKDIKQALSVLKAVRDRSRNAARLGEAYKRANIRGKKA